MENRHPKRVEDYTTANMVLIFVNLLWVFVALWSFWGLGVVLILAMLLNHLITRIDIVRRRRDNRFRGI
ncbi:histidinol phosphate aminotransferase [Antarctobacter heliothermus]|uniref:Histidinol phosphate aminotransferase n=1 Tax=Antarctobacter heliothermus TaxID=74033 RepID=A0A239K358_9RHOB|nr:histidinol phosphate aminotransferase [Antarctobacter heliothermus]SNT12112.1 hypothetical protein SAMN04488078_106011 [Antarctobacter heliothermus]